MRMSPRSQRAPVVAQRGTLRGTLSSVFIEAHYRLVTARFKAMSDTSVKAPNGGATAIPPTRNMQATNPGGTPPTTYFRKGFGLKAQIQTELDSDYTGQLVDMLQARDYTLHA